MTNGSGPRETGRKDGRRADELRRIAIVPEVNPYAEGSVEVHFGRTKLLVTVSVEREVPEWLKLKNEGWITAEYGMLPRSTHTRNKREASSGKQSGRTLEIQRLIGRALRASIDLRKLGPLTLRVDCDVFCADGGTRTAAISGAWVALQLAVWRVAALGFVSERLNLRQVAAISVGRFEGKPLLDLCYEEDSRADFDMNIVMDADGGVIEIQGTAERAAVPVAEITSLAELAAGGIKQIFEIQRDALRVC